MNILPAPNVYENFSTSTPLPTDPTYGWFFEVQNWSRFSLVPDPVDPSKDVLKVTVHPGDQVNGGERAECSYQSADPPTYERHFSWEVLFPTDYADPTPGDWQHMGQWHDQPEDGNWSGYPPNSPPISVDYEYTVVSALPQLAIDMLDQYFPGWQSMVVSDRLPVMVVTVGTVVPKAPIAIIPFQKGVWQKLMVKIKWSHDEAGGFVKVYHNDVQVGEHLGKNMHNDFPHYFKLGIYRKPVSEINSVYYREINIAHP